MRPANFEHSNCSLDSPSNMKTDDCEPLFVYRGLDGRDRPVVISCWKPTAEEIAEIQRTGRVWLTVCGGMMPPVTISSTSPWRDPE